jgi:hypothetical protein
MTAAAFQSALARLVIDPEFRDEVKAGKSEPLRGLSARERARIVAVAADRGLDITRRMYVSFRLARLEVGAPRTFRTLSRLGLEKELERYLAHRRPASFYHLVEGRALLRFFSRRMREGALDDPELARAIAEDEKELDRERATWRKLGGRVRLGRA